MGREGTGRDPDNLTSFDALNIPRVARSSPVLSRATTNAHVVPEGGAPMGNIANTHVAAQSGNGHTPTQQVFPSAETQTISTSTSTSTP
ncbi:hypothetical protein FIBSPDRAFT_875012, partial [Athelia psychrophila]